MTDHNEGAALVGPDGATRASGWREKYFGSAQTGRSGGMARESVQDRLQGGTRPSERNHQRSAAALKNYTYTIPEHK
jgi:hypothetical protein